ncbi:hypothetical protein AtNW77_Chr5g0136521 [Arabidopsis thaliana]
MFLLAQDNWFPKDDCYNTVVLIPTHPNLNINKCFKVYQYFVLRKQCLQTN